MSWKSGIVYTSGDEIAQDCISTTDPIVLIRNKCFINYLEAAHCRCFNFFINKNETVHFRSRTLPRILEHIRNEYNNFKNLQVVYSVVYQQVFIAFKNEFKFFVYVLVFSYKSSLSFWSWLKLYVHSFWRKKKLYSEGKFWFKNLKKIKIKGCDAYSRLALYQMHLFSIILVNQSKCRLTLAQTIWSIKNLKV